MPPKNCGSCQKTVYPMDELKCLDKTWHKACFRCQECKMTLNMKNYKGYDKLPYCNAHYPTTKHTAVAETPETRRIAKNTKLQSNVQYHSEFEKTRGQYTSVADDPETLRVKKNTQTISNIAYHGDMLRKEEMENARPGEVEAQAGRTAQPRKPGSISEFEPSANGSTASPYAARTQSTTVYSSAPDTKQQVYSRSRRIGSINDYDPINDNFGSITEPKQPVYNAEKKEPVHGLEAPDVIPKAAPRVEPRAEPVARPAPAPAPAPRELSPETVAPVPVPRSPSPETVAPVPVPQAPSPEPVRVPTPEPLREPTPPPPRDPTPEPEPEPESPVFEPEAQVVNPEPQVVKPEPEPAPRTEATATGKLAIALYDYAAGDEDEVSFAEGDRMVECEPIDEGWMTATNEKTGDRGMLPSNYVQPQGW